MPISRDTLFAEKSPHQIIDDELKNLKEYLKDKKDPMEQRKWVDIIRERLSCSTNKAVKTFEKLIKEKFITWQRIYRGRAIYVISQSPLWFRNKTPVLVAET